MGRNMKVGICDDKTADRAEARRFCEKYAEEQAISMEILEFASGEEVLSYDGHISILLLDIEMGGLSGLEVKERLYEKDRQPVILFTTAHEELMQEAFGISVCGFVRKPMEWLYFEKVFTKALQLAPRNRLIRVGEKEQPVYLECRKVLFIRSERVYSVLHTKENGYLLRKSLNEWEEELEGCGFYRIQKSWLINLDAVQRVEKGNVLQLSDGSRVRLGREVRRTFPEVYEKHCFLRAKYV